MVCRLQRAAGLFFEIVHGCGVEGRGFGDGEREGQF